MTRVGTLAVLTSMAADGTDTELPVLRTANGRFLNLLMPDSMSDEELMRNLGKRVKLRGQRMRRKGVPTPNWGSGRPEAKETESDQFDVELVEERKDTVSLTHHTVLCHPCGKHDSCCCIAT